MRLNKFLEKFLPDYEARLNRFRIEESYTPVAFEINGVKEFCVRNFPEALQNFADRICEKQREICADAHINPQYPDEYENGCDVDCLTRFNIRESEQPKIEEV